MNLPATLCAWTELGLTPGPLGLGKSKDAYGVTNDVFELAAENGLFIACELLEITLTYKDNRKFNFSFETVRIKSLIVDMANSTSYIFLTWSLGVIPFLILFKGIVPGWGNPPSIMWRDEANILASSNDSASSLFSDFFAFCRKWINMIVIAIHITWKWN